MRALLLHAEPDELLPMLEEGCEGASWATASRPDEVEPALERHQPEVVFSIKQSLFPGASHRPAIVFPSVRWFQIGGSGREHLGAWDAEQLVVTDGAGVLAPFLAERALAALTFLSTGMFELGRDQARGEWAPSAFVPLAGRTLLVVGVGHCGGELAKRARALGMHVLGVRTRAEPHEHVDEMFTPDVLGALVERADVISLHARLTEQTRGMVSRDILRKVRPGTVLLNSARGPIVDEEALLEALDPEQGGNIASAWLDVFAVEPLPEGHPFWTHPRVLITPHCADQVEGWPRLFAARFIENWARYRQGRELISVVRAT